MQEKTYHGGACCQQKHKSIRLEYNNYHLDPEQWALDVEYIETQIPNMPQSLLDGLYEHLDCSPHWIDGEGDGDIADVDEAVQYWYDNNFRPYLRQMCRVELHKINLPMNWKAFECWLFNFYMQDEDHPAGTMISAAAHIEDLRQ